MRFYKLKTLLIRVFQFLLWWLYRMQDKVDVFCMKQES